MKTSFLVGLAIVFLTISVSAHAVQRWVPSTPCPTIQSALDASSPGDTVVVECGTYTWSGEGTGNADGLIRMKSNVTLLSESCLSGNCDPSRATIDAEDQGRVVYCANLGPVTRIEGFTVTGGYTTGHGGGIYCSYDSTTISRCNITDNEADHGGGLHITHSGTTVEYCTVGNNTARTGGGFAMTYGVRKYVHNCVISYNTATHGGGGGLLLSSARHGTEMTGCVVHHNSAPAYRGGAVYCANDDNSDVTNCTFADNFGGVASFYVYDGGVPTLSRTIIATSSGEKALYCDQSDDPVNPTTECCDIYDLVGSAICGTDGGGNFSADPLFCDAGTGDYRLEPGSPCAPGNHPLGYDCGLIGALPVCEAVLDASLDMDPNTLNLQSKGKYVTCYIELPQGHDPAEIDVSTVLFNDILPAVLSPTGVGDHDNDGIADRMVKFSRSGVIAFLAGGDQSNWTPLADGDEFDVTVTGELTGGTAFSGTDVIRVIDPAMGSDNSLGLEVFPTPLIHTTTISYEVTKEGPVKLRVYDVAGRLVSTLVARHKAAGTYKVTWDRNADDGSRVSAGVYFFTLEQHGKVGVEKVLIVD